MGQKREKKTPLAPTSQVAKPRKPGPKPKPGPLLDAAWEETETRALCRIFGLPPDPALPARIYEPQEPEPTIGPSDEYFGATLSECAAELGVSKERIRQIELRALTKLREAPRSTRLLDAWRGAVPPEAPPPKPESDTFEEQRRRAPWKHFPEPEQLDRALRRARMTDDQRWHETRQVARHGLARWEQALRQDPSLVNPRRRRYYRHECDACDFTVTTECKGCPWTWSKLALLHPALRTIDICQQCQHRLTLAVARWLVARRAELRQARREGRLPWPRQPKRSFVGR